MQTRKHFIPTLSSFFDDFLTKDIVNMGHEITKNFINHLPAVNIKEDQQTYFVELAAPGLEKEDFSIELNKNILTISSNKTSNQDNKTSAGYVRREFNYAAFSRSFTLPEGKFDTGKIGASYNNGVLSVKVEKLAKEKQKIVKTISVS